VLELTSAKVFELFDRFWLIRKQEQTCSGIFVHLNRAVMDAIINPMWVHVKAMRNL